MNRKEVAELRRRFRAEKSTISQIYGCFVNTKREIVSYLDTPLSLLSQEECETYLSLLKKTLSGSLGKNLVDIVFSTQQVAQSEEHRLLCALRDCEARDTALREQFYERVIPRLAMEDTNYLLLLAADSYDVRGAAGEDDEVYRYLICAVCPVKDAGSALRYYGGENEFHCASNGLTVSAPETGFLFPAFDDRRANLYNALFYTRSIAKIHQELIDAVFCTDPPLSAQEQREAFEGALQESLGEGCDFALLRSLHEQLSVALEEHKNTGSDEALSLSTDALCALLQRAGVEDADRLAQFRESYTQRVDGAAAVCAENLVESKRFELLCESFRLQVVPEESYRVKLERLEDGRQVLILPVDATLTLNGQSVSLPGAAAGAEDY